MSPATSTLRFSNLPSGKGVNDSLRPTHVFEVRAQLDNGQQSVLLTEEKNKCQPLPPELINFNKLVIDKKCVSVTSDPRRHIRWRKAEITFV
jgi:hypothetical protein